MDGTVSVLDLGKCAELVIVCCHAVYTGDGLNHAEDQWLLQDFQRSDPSTGKPSEHETFIAHIFAGMLAAKDRPQTLLMFSGGRTISADRSEAEGYEKIFLDLGKRFGSRPPHALENHATDSYQNLLFSILRFRQLTSHYPQLITVITHAFKERRFLELHAPAIKWPADRVRIQGINPPFTKAELEETERLSSERAFRLFEEDPYGVRSPLADKRLARNWKESEMLEAFSCLDVEVQSLLRWRGDDGEDIFSGRLPWEGSVRGNHTLSTQNDVAEGAKA